MSARVDFPRLADMADDGDWPDIATATEAREALATIDWLMSVIRAQADGTIPPSPPPVRPAVAGGDAGTVVTPAVPVLIDADDDAWLTRIAGTS